MILKQLELVCNKGYYFNDIIIIILMKKSVDDNILFILFVNVWF